MNIATTLLKQFLRSFFMASIVIVFAGCVGGGSETGSTSDNGSEGVESPVSDDNTNNGNENEENEEEQQVEEESPPPTGTTIISGRA